MFTNKEQLCQSFRQLATEQKFIASPPSPPPLPKAFRVKGFQHVQSCKIQDGCKLPAGCLPDSSIHCNFLKSIAVHSLSTAIYCEHSRGHLQCPRGQILKIVSANYGRRAGPSICPHRLTRNRNCGARSSLYKVRAACQDKPSCRLWASNRVFGDPCRGTYKYLQVGYRCARRKFSNFE